MILANCDYLLLVYWNELHLEGERRRTSVATRGRSWFNDDVVAATSLVWVMWHRIHFKELLLWLRVGCELEHMRHIGSPDSSSSISHAPQSRLRTSVAHARTSVALRTSTVIIGTSGVIIGTSTGTEVDNQLQWALH